MVPAHPIVSLVTDALGEIAHGFLGMAPGQAFGAGAGGAQFDQLEVGFTVHDILLLAAVQRKDAMAREARHEAYKRPISRLFGPCL